MPENNGRGSRNRWTPDGGGSGGSGTPKPRFSPWLAVPLLLLGLLIFSSYLNNAGTEQIDLSTFIGYAENGQIVGTVEITPPTVSGQFKADGEATNSPLRCRLDFDSSTLTSPIPRLESESTTRASSRACSRRSS